MCESLQFIRKCFISGTLKFSVRVTYFWLIMHLSLCDQFASPRALQDLPGQSTPSKKTQHVQEISLEATLKEKTAQRGPRETCLGCERRAGRLVCRNNAMHAVSSHRGSLACRNISQFVQATDVCLNPSALLEMQLTRPAALNCQMLVDVASAYQFVLREEHRTGQHRT